jgi:prolyl 4-hydroxylase
VHVEEGLTGGGTNFPILDAPKGDRGEKWCEWIDCDEPWENGVTFKPIEGNAVFWGNMVDDGRGIMVGDERVLHAGLPVTSGRKVGMNIWTREGSISEEFREAEGLI